MSTRKRGGAQLAACVYLIEEEALPSESSGLYMIAGGGNKLPYGNIPRLLPAWISTEAVRSSEAPAGHARQT